MAVTYEFANDIGDKQFAPGGPQYAAYLAAVRAGRLWSLLPGDWAAAGDVELKARGAAARGAAAAAGDGAKKAA